MQTIFNSHVFHLECISLHILFVCDFCLMSKSQQKKNVKHLRYSQFTMLVKRFFFGYLWMNNLIENNFV